MKDEKLITVCNNYVLKNNYTTDIYYFMLYLLMYFTFYLVHFVTFVICALLLLVSPLRSHSQNYLKVGSKFKLALTDRGTEKEAECNLGHNNIQYNKR